MKVIAVTGGIASGKTTVANIFNQLYKIPIIDSDEITHQILSSDQNIIDKISKKFPKTVSNNTIDRKLLRNFVFTEKENKKWLEYLLHPIINQGIIKQINGLSNSNKHDYCLILIPLITKEYLAANNFIDHVLVVNTNSANQIDRAISRDKQTPEQIQNVIDNQISTKDRLSLADSLITNNSSVDELKTQVYDLHKKFIDL